MTEHSSPSALDLATDNFIKSYDKYAHNLTPRSEDAKKFATELDELRTKSPAERTTGVLAIINQLTLKEDDREALSSFVTNLLSLLHLALDVGAQVAVLDFCNGQS